MAMSPKKVAIAWLNPFSPNRGVGALAYSTLALLDELSRSSDVLLEIFVTSIEGHSDIPIGNHTIRINGVGLPCKFLSRGFLKFALFPRILLSVLKIRYWMDMGDGDSFSDLYGAERFSQINFTKRFLHLLRKRQLMLPQTVGPFLAPSTRKRAKNGLAAMNMILVRDAKSRECVLDLLPQAKVSEVVDVAFFLPFERASFDRRFIHVGVNVSALLWHGGYTRSNQFGLEADYKQCCRSIITDLLRRERIKLHLIAHVCLDHADVENDYQIALWLHKELAHPNLVLAPFFLDPMQAKSYISGLEFFCGSRMHACIAAFSSGVATVPLAYSRKFTGLFEDTLRFPYVIDLRDTITPEVCRKLAVCFDRRESMAEETSSILENTIFPMRKQILDSFREFLDL